MTKSEYFNLKIVWAVVILVLGVLGIKQSYADTISVVAGGSSYHFDQRTYTIEGVTYDINEVHPALGIRFGFDSESGKFEHGYGILFIKENSFRESSFCAMYNPRVPVGSFGFVGARLGACTGYEFHYSHGVAPVGALEAGVELLDNTYMVFGVQAPGVATFHMEYKF